MLEINWTAVQAIVGIFASFIGALTFIALVWYALETRNLRLETQRQTRLTSLPIARVAFHHSPPRIFVWNTGQAIVGRVALQGFRFRGTDGGVWKCTFTPVTMLSQASSIPLFDEIVLDDFEGTAMLDERALYDIAFNHALRGRESMRLAFYATDVFGSSSYRSHVEIPRIDDRLTLRFIQEHSFSTNNCWETREGFCRLDPELAAQIGGWTSSLRSPVTDVVRQVTITIASVPPT